MTSLLPTKVMSFFGGAKSEKYEDEPPSPSLALSPTKSVGSV